MPLFYYRNTTSEFLKDADDSILGRLAESHKPFTLGPTQTRAWLAQIKNLKAQLQNVPAGEIFFEFTIPRMGKRVDVLLLIKNMIFVLEYKVGADSYDKAANDQALDYALDLKDFHEGSHHRYIVPIVVATAAITKENYIFWSEDGVASPLSANKDNLGALILDAYNDKYSYVPGRLPTGVMETPDNKYDAGDWAKTGYKPTPTIIEAAQALYKGHSVKEISRSDAGATNLTKTASCISEIIKESKNNKQKSICFVTGVPGAGKTLAGLNIVTEKRSEHAVFLSGNGPLVEVLREALIKSEKSRENPRNKIESKVRAFIQNVHHYRDAYAHNDDIPPDYIVVFDEAQRAWDQSKLEKHMAERGHDDFGMSEPEFLISVADRRKNDWCTIICLIGNGQEISTGEAGLLEWLKAVESHFPHWKVYHSGHLNDPNLHSNQDLQEKLHSIKAIERPDLHLSTSIRSYREGKISEFIAAIINGDKNQAQEISKKLEKYPLAITRNLNKARYWLKQHARGTQRLGLVASAGAIRLKPEGLYVKNKIDPANWFLNSKEDIRSSYYLEDVATEFDIQGLELDWVGVCWDADFRRENNQWAFYDFRGTKWQHIHKPAEQTYLANAYRVLLTRARQGMVIFVPEGDQEDHTRPPSYYDGIYNFLKDCGFPEI
mgnify:CR=1 FL=1